MYTLTDREQKDCKCLSDGTDFKYVLICKLCTFSYRGATKERLSPDIVLQKSLKYMNDVSCVDQLSFVQSVKNVPIAAPDFPVGARLQDSTSFGKL